MDTTAIGITAGLLVTALYVIIRAVRQKSFDIGMTILVFLAGFSIPEGTRLIRAALSGDPNTLLPSWREYVAVAGIAVIGLSAHFLIQSLRNVWAKQAMVAPASEQQNETSNSKNQTS
jgi:hypothetical protein